MFSFLQQKSAFINVDGHPERDISSNEKAKDTFIIGAGFCRTGTSSMQIALSKLGWRSFHMREVGKNGSECCNSIIKAGRLKCALREQMKDYDPSFKNYDKMVLSPDAFDWNEIFNNPKFGKYTATVDNPLCAFYLDLMEFYKPNYKVILTVRDDAEQWYNSVDRTVRQFHVLMNTFAMRFILWTAGLDSSTMTNVTYDHLVFDAPIGKYVDFWDDRPKCIQKYEDWIDGVKKHVPEDKLLVFNVKEG